MPKLDAGGVANVAVAIVFVVVDSLAVFLRMLAKSKTKYYFSSDDYWILAALFFFFAWAGPILYAIFGLAGSLDVTIRMEVGDVQQVLKFLWVTELFFPLTITCVKLSVLCFYRTIFSTRSFRLITHAVSAVCVMWMLATCWVIVFQCRPVRAVYNPSLAATADCVSFAWFVFTSELTNALIDVSILALPIYLVRKLQMKTRRKIQVISVFAMGGLVLIACVLRLVYFPWDPNEPWKVPPFSRGILWSTIQLGVALISACVPTYRPLLIHNWGISAVIKSWLPSLLNNSNAGSHNPSRGKKRSASARLNQHGLNSDDKICLTETRAWAEYGDEQNHLQSYS